MQRGLAQPDDGTQREEPAQGRPELDWQAGIFLAVPLTHFETKGEAGDWKEKANRAGYEVAELDW